MSGTTNGKFDNWQFLIKEVKRKTLRPLEHPTFIIYFVVAVLGIGALGLWAEIVAYFGGSGKGLAGFQSIFYTFIPAFVAPTSMQLLLAEKHKSLRAFTFLLVTLCSLTLWLCMTIMSWSAVWFGLASTAIGMWLWWITNAEQSDFTDEKPDPDDATGGKNPGNAKLSGSLAGFQV